MQEGLNFIFTGVLKEKSNLWYLNGLCSRHMTEDASMFTKFWKKKSGKVAFGDNHQGNILGISKIGKDGINSIDNVDLVDGLKYNLLSSLQLYDKDNMYGLINPNMLLKIPYAMTLFIIVLDETMFMP